jgi:predicted Rossmann fold nucleotide-binding protein DprA/Smf involved in DNA uptake
MEYKMVTYVVPRADAQRDMPPPDDTHDWKIRSAHLDQAGQPSVLVAHWEGSPHRPAKEPEPVNARIMAELRKGARTVQELRTQTGTSNSTISAALNELERTGSVERAGKAPGKGGAELWRLGH